MFKWFDCCNSGWLKYFTKNSSGWLSISLNLAEILPSTILWLLSSNKKNKLLLSTWKFVRDLKKKVFTNKTLYLSSIYIYVLFLIYIAIFLAFCDRHWYLHPNINFYHPLFCNSITSVYLGLYLLSYKVHFPMYFM